MMLFLGRLADRWFPSWNRSAINGRTLVERYGFARSVAQLEPVDASGAPLPWYTYPAIEYLSQLDFSARLVFEYGAGNSSRFWAARAARVCSVDNDRQWHAALAAKAPNLEIHLCEDKEAYVSCIARQAVKFHLIAIDGRWRRACARAAPACLAAGGIILLDNTDWYPRTAGELRAAGFMQIDFSGFGPINAYTWTTSLFVRAEAGLQAGFRDPAPIGGLRQHDPETD
jgi:hypothetical protein